MIQQWLACGMLAAALACGGCGSDQPREPRKREPPMPVEDTAFGTLIGTKDKARDQTEAAMEAHKEMLQRQMKASEGGPPEE